MDLQSAGGSPAPGVSTLQTLFLGCRQPEAPGDTGGASSPWRVRALPPSCSQTPEPKGPAAALILPAPRPSPTLRRGSCWAPSGQAQATWELPQAPLPCGAAGSNQPAAQVLLSPRVAPAPGPALAAEGGMQPAMLCTPVRRRPQGSCWAPAAASPGGQLGAASSASAPATANMLRAGGVLVPQAGTAARGSCAAWLLPAPRLSPQNTCTGHKFSWPSAGDEAAGADAEAATRKAEHQAELAGRDAEITMRNAELAQRDVELFAQAAEIARGHAEAQERQVELARARAEAEERRAELVRARAEVAQQREELAQREELLAGKEEIIASQDKVISVRLNEHRTRIASRAADDVRADAALCTDPDPRPPWQGPAAGAGWTPLHLAALRGEGSAVRSLLAGRAELAAGTADGETPLHLAALSGDSSALSALLESRASPQAVDRDSWTPLHFAAKAGHAAAARVLLAGGASPDSRDGSLETPLHKAARGGHASAVRALLEGGAERGAPDGDLWMPLRRVLELIEGATAVGARNGNGKTPLDIAEGDALRVLQGCR